MKEVFYCENYAPSSNTTFITEETFEDKELVKSEVVGFYSGKPNEYATKLYYGKTSHCYPKIDFSKIMCRA